VSGNYAYLANGYDCLRVYDISNPANPVNVGHINDGGNGDAAVGVAVSGNYAYLAYVGDGLRVYDISNPANPVNVGHTNNGGYADGVAVSGNYAYLANGDDGLRVYSLGSANASAFRGNGRLLTGLDAGNLATGTLADARLSTNVARLNANQTFTGGNAFTQPVNAPAFQGDGSLLTGLDAGNVATGTLADARLSTNVARLNANQTFTGANVFTHPVYVGSAQLGTDQGGSLELGNSLSTGVTPYIDFHYGVGSPQAWNVRLINNANNLLTCSGNFWALSFGTTSDRDAKENLQPVKPRQVLEKVAALLLSQWTFKAAPGEQHLGPMAQDFRAAFGLGADERHIATVDADGVALAAIQGLNQKLQEELGSVRAENAELKARLERLEQLINAKSGGGK
jgi:hypothetical protein